MNNPGDPGDAQVSVIIVNFNAGKWLERCLESLHAQTRKPLEIIVVDNASSDASTKTIHARFPSVRLIELSQNIGFAAANNFAVRSASNQSHWLALLNPDAFPDPDWLETLLEAAQAHPEHAVFGSRLMDANNPVFLDGTGDAYHPSGLVWRNGHGTRFDSAQSEMKEIFSACAAATLLRKDAFVQAGGFDEDFFCYVEDVDLGFRLRLLGLGCLYVPDAVAYHIGSAITGRRSDFSVYYGHRNLVWTYVKNMPGALFWIFLPFHLALNLLSVIYFSARGKGRLILRSKRDSIKGMPAMWRKRQLIQSTRVATLGEIWQCMDKGFIPERSPGRGIP
ncbi:MAG: glycosyltransferase family 2 protein [Methylococcales bacterium]